MKSTHWTRLAKQMFVSLNVLLVLGLNDGKCISNREKNCSAEQSKHCEEYEEELRNCP